MNRYQETLNIDTTKSVPYYQTTILNTVPQESLPFYYTARQNERLDTISTMFYKTPSKWWIIAKANNLSNGVIAVSAGTKLFIPNI